MKTETSLINSYQLEQLKEIKEIALVRLKTALMDRRAVYNDLPPDELDVIVSRCSLLFKYLVSLAANRANEWFLIPSSLTPTVDKKPNLDDAQYVFARFQETGDLTFSKEFDFEESEIIAAIMWHIWQTNNVDNTDFTFFCNYLHLDEATYNMVKRALRTKVTSDADIYVKIQECMCSVLDLYVLLTMANVEASKLPFKVDWMSVAVEENELTVEQVAALEEILYNGVQQILAVPGDANLTDCGSAVQQLHQTVADIDEKLQEAHAVVKKLNETDLIEMIEEHVPVIVERRQIIRNHIPAHIREHRVYSEVEIIAASNELQYIRNEAAFLRNASLTPVPTNGKTLAEKLVLQRGQACLARRKNSHYFIPAKIVARQMNTGSLYTVEFLDNSEYSTLDVSEIANTDVPLFDSSFGINLNRFIGLRVAAYVEVKGFGMKWMAGTVGATFGTHGDDFLVFFDRHMDRYISPVYQAEKAAAQKYRELESEKPVTNKELFDWIRERTRLLHMFPLCEQCFTPAGNEICRTNVYELISKSDEIRTFLHRYFDKFPDWPLVRMRKPAPGTIPQRISMVDKRTAFVIEVKNCMCVVRYPKHGEPGDDCFDYNCTVGHLHDDEWLYRGSTRINTMNLDRSDNTNLSTRQKNRNQTYYDEETKKNTARKSGIPTQGYNYYVLPSSVSKEELSERNKKANKFKVTSILCDVSERGYKAHASCNKDCLRGIEKNPYDPAFKGISPLAVPLLCGWERSKYKMNGSKFSDRGKSKNAGKFIVYTSPCGKTLRNMAAIGKFLRMCDSQLTIDLFSHNLFIDPLKVIEVEKSAIIIEDYTQGQEYFPIPAVNTLDHELPPKIQYGARKYPFDERVNMSTIHKDFCSGCSCEDDCSDPNKCECQRLTTDSVKRLADTIRPREYGYKSRSLQAKTCTGIFECNENCSCNSKKCWNRVVQNEIKYPLQLFKTAGCGWGVRTVCDIPRGAFIANYVGALMTDEIAEIKGKNDDQYFADLDLNDGVEKEKIIAQRRYGHLRVGDFEPEEENDEGVPDIDGEFTSDDEEPPKKIGRRPFQEEGNDRKKMNKKRGRKQQLVFEEEIPVFKWSDYFGETEELFVLDAKYKGNIGRFLNHSCEPNVHVQHVLVDTHDLRLPWTSFFAITDIKAGEELCWNYNYHINEERPVELQVICHCGSKFCTGRLL